MKLSKKFFALVLSVVMIISVMPISTYAATPSTKKTETSVACASTWSVEDLAGEKCYYFDSLQEAFDYLNEDPDFGVVTLVKDVELEDAIQFTDKQEGQYFQWYEYNTIYFELNGHTITAPNGNAFEFDKMACNIFFDGFQFDYNAGDGITDYGGVIAKDYAVQMTDSQNSASLVISGGTYKTETKDAPFSVDATNGGICNVRQSKYLKSDSLVYNETGYFGEAGTESNVFLRHVNGDHFAYFHVNDTDDAYVVEAHDFGSGTITNVASDRQSATIDRKCEACSYISETKDAVALIGDKGYLSLAAALVSVPDGEAATVELLADNAALPTSIYVTDNKDITLELNDHTVNHTAGYFVVNGGELTIQNGTINSSSNMTVIVQGTADSSIKNYSVLNIDNATVNNTYKNGDNVGTAIHIDNPYTNWAPPVKNFGISININNSSVTAEGYALANNGNYREGENVNIISIANSNLKSTYATSMYIAGYAVVDTVASTFTGEISGAEIRAGVLNIKGSENIFTATTNEGPSNVANGSGTTVVGAGLGISQHHIAGYGSNPIVVNIEGGKFEGPQAVSEVYTLDDESWKNTTLNIEGGRFNDTAEKKNDAVESVNDTKFMTGGTYSTKPNDSYVADKYKAIYDGDEEETWTIRPAIVFFNSGDVEYEKEYHEIFTHTEVDANNQKVQAFTTIPKLKDPDGDIFTGWTYEKGNFNTLFSMNDTIDTEINTNVYANWEPISTVQKDVKDEKNVPNNEYKSFGLAGIQIREDGTKEKNGTDVYGGLRFIGSFSEELVNSLSSGNLEILEYGFVVATKENADKNAIGNEKYQIKNGDKNVKRINCMGNKDHRNFNDYRLFTMVIDYEGNEALKNTEFVARAYIAYKDANGVKRIFYNDYDGTNIYGGCSVSYNQAATM